MIDFIDYKIGVLILIALIIVCDTVVKIDNRQNYIQTLETKLNTYEQRYENYCVEDSIKQEELYE